MPKDPSRLLRILLLAPPMLPVPPPFYAGTERVISVLGEELHRRGHHVAVVASGDSEVPYELIRTVEASLWRSGYTGDVTSYMQFTVGVATRVAARFDIIHSHLEGQGMVFARYSPVPMVITLHGRLDVAGMPELLSEFRDVPLVAISESQRRWHTDQNWVATIHHGLDLDQMPFEPEPGDYLAFVGRATPEKGLVDAIELARRVRLRLRVAAKVHDPHEKTYFRRWVKPAIDDGTVDFLGELGPGDRDPLFAGARATLMLGAWPEPFGLVAIESMATGTPVIARRAGALTETIDHGVTGFLVDDESEAAHAVEQVPRLDRHEIRRIALERFSVSRMADEYERVYRQLIAERTYPPYQPALSLQPTRLKPVCNAERPPGSALDDDRAQAGMERGPDNGARPGHGTAGRARANGRPAARGARSRGRAGARGISRGST